MKITVQMRPWEKDPGILCTICFWNVSSIWQKHWGPHRNWCLLASLTVNYRLVHREIWLIAQSTLLICCPLDADCKVLPICSSGTVNTQLSVYSLSEEWSFVAVNLWWLIRCTTLHCWAHRKLLKSLCTTTSNDQLNLL